jgi:serine phosphatase RsbU (regulator of sigma subunit)
MAGKPQEVNNYDDTRQRLDSAVKAIERTAAKLSPAVESAINTERHYAAIATGYEKCLKQLRAADTTDPRVLGLIETGKKMFRTAERTRDYWRERHQREEDRRDKLNDVRNELIHARNRLDVAQKLADGHAHLASLAALGDPPPTTDNAEQPEFREALRLAREAEALAELKEWR